MQSSSLHQPISHKGQRTPTLWTQKMTWYGRTTLMSLKVTMNPRFARQDILWLKIVCFYCNCWPCSCLGVILSDWEGPLLLQEKSNKLMLQVGLHYWNKDINSTTSVYSKMDVDCIWYLHYKIFIYRNNGNCSNRICHELNKTKNKIFQSSTSLG